jgi:hypothetical protein
MLSTHVWVAEYYFLFSGSLMQKPTAERVRVEHSHHIVNIRIRLDLILL